MALPTMRGYWSTRKNIYEQAIVSARNREDDYRNKWSDTANYFKKSDVRAAKQNAWSSTQAFQDSMDAYEASIDKDIKSSNLKRRKDKLSRLFAEENENYQDELRSMSRPDSRLEDMRSRADGLKSAREEKRQKLAEEKLYQHWRDNNPDLRQAESDMLQEHVVGGWGDQIQERNERLESARQENAAIERQMEEERRAALELERRKEQERLEEKKSLKEVLREQMIEFKAREAEAKEWRLQQEMLLRQRWEIEQLEEKQRQKEEDHRRKDLGRALLRQHKAQMMRKSKVIQEELEQDRKLLESLIDKEREDVALQTARREQDKADAQWMKQVIEDQLRLEKAREAELDMLYQDEAARMWQKRENEWERERQARQRLMSEVLEERQAQISAQLEELQQQQEESLHRREELVREMELAQREARLEEEQRERGKLTTRADLEDQMYSRQAQERDSRARAQKELQEEMEEEKGYEDLLREETERLRLQGFTPRPHGRRQAWN